MLDNVAQDSNWLVIFFIFILGDQLVKLCINSKDQMY